MNTENKRQRLIDAAYKVFAQKGFTNASVKDIAREADITPGLVHYYFKNKEELLLSVQQQTQQKYHKNYEGAHAESHSIADTLMEIKSRAEKDPDWYRWRFELYSLGLKNAQLQHEVALILQNGRESLKDPIQQVFDQEKDAEALASIFLACFDGLALQKIVDPQFDLERPYNLLAELTEVYLKK